MRLHLPFLRPFVCLAGGELGGLVAPNRIREAGKCRSVHTTVHSKLIFINSFYISISSAFSVVGRRPVRRSSSLSAYLTSRGGDGQRRVGNSSSRRRHLQQQQQQPRPLVDARVRSASTSGLDRWQKVNWHTFFENHPSYDKTILIHSSMQPSPGSSTVEEEVTLYRTPCQRLGLGLRFVGGGIGKTDKV